MAGRPGSKLVIPLGPAPLAAACPTGSGAPINTFQERSDLVRRLVTTNFAGYEEAQLRNLQWCVLQMLAPLCAPPNQVVPHDVESIVRVVVEAKREIEVLEYKRKHGTPRERQADRPASVSSAFVPERMVGFVCPTPVRPQPVRPVVMRLAAPNDSGGSGGPRVHFAL